MREDLVKEMTLCFTLVWKRVEAIRIVWQRQCDGKVQKWFKRLSKRYTNLILEKFKVNNSLTFVSRYGKEFLPAQESAHFPLLSGLTIRLYVLTTECGVDMMHATLGPGLWNASLALLRVFFSSLTKWRWLWVEAPSDERKPPSAWGSERMYGTEPACQPQTTWHY